MADHRNRRGSGVKFTVPFLVRFSGLWMAVTIAAILVFSATSYLMMSDRIGQDGKGNLVTILAVQTIVLVLAIVALAVFTTHRLAGPYIALKRAFEEVKRGQLDHPLRFRNADVHLQDLETSFNEMTEALRHKLQGGAPPSA
jgi:HAMP domain-containing protein